MLKVKLAKTSLDEKIKGLVQETGHKELALWAADCAERALPFFEDKYPSDLRPRQAIAAARAWARGEIKCGAARKAAFLAHAAARDAAEIAACTAARATGHAAATAHGPGHARDVAIYAATAVSAHAAETEGAWQYRHLLEQGQAGRSEEGAGAG